MAGGAAPGLSRHWPLIAAAAVLTGLWAGPLPDLSRVSFSAHMALHLGLVLVAAPLLALGFARSGAMRGVRLGAAAAVAFAAIEMLAVWGWHAPALHEAAALRPWAFVVQQVTFLGAGLLVWLPGLADGGREQSAAGMIATAASFAHMTMLGVLLTIAPGVIYPEGLCGGAFDLDPLTDQRVGGMLMALVGGAVYLLGGLWFTARLVGGTPDR